MSVRRALPRAAIAGAALAVLLGLRAGRAATFETAPPASRAQVRAALEALAPAFADAPAREARPGTLQRALLGYFPARAHAVDEGTLPPLLRAGRCPSDMRLAGGRTCVDRYEGSLFERTAEGGLVPHSPLAVPRDDGRYVAATVAGATPQAYVSAKVAASACRAAGKRLCGAAEWRLACGGSKGTAYPYGPTRVAGACRDTGAVPMLVFHAGTMKRGWGREELNDPRLNALEGTVATTGSHPACVTDEGLFDMVGNLHEWTADANGTFQGGYWLDTSQHGEGCAYRTIAHGFEYHDYSTGFRCCRDPDAAAVADDGGAPR